MTKHLGSSHDWQEGGQRMIAAAAPHHRHTGHAIVAGEASTRRSGR